MYRPINGWTKAKILKRIRDRFTVKSVMDDVCLYRGKVDNVKTMCAFGLFIPDKLYDEGMERKVAKDVLSEWPKLMRVVPLSSNGMALLQAAHDDSVGKTKEKLLNWVKENVKDAKTK